MARSGGGCRLIAAEELLDPRTLSSSIPVWPGRMSALTTSDTRGWSAVMVSTHSLSTAITSSHSPSRFVNIAFVSCGSPDARTMRTASATAAAYDPRRPGRRGRC